jgi:hypothetical protein
MQDGGGSSCEFVGAGVDPVQEIVEVFQVGAAALPGLFPVPPAVHRPRRRDGRWRLGCGLLRVDGQGSMGAEVPGEEVPGCDCSNYLAHVGRAIWRYPGDDDPPACLHHGWRPSTKPDVS